MYLDTLASSECNSVHSDVYCEKN